MTTIEIEYTSYLNKIEASPVHPLVASGFISIDESVESQCLDGTAMEDIDNELATLLGGRAKQMTPKRITDEVIVEPIKRMEKHKEEQDFCRQVTVHLVETQSLDRQMEELINIMQLSQAPGTKLVQDYAWRSWMGWLEQQNQTHEELKTIDHYNPGKHVVELYLLHMRVLYQYSHSTVVNCFWNQLCAVLKEERGIDLKMGEFIKKLFRALIRKYGNSKFKVFPLLNHDLARWQRALSKKDNREPQVRLRAIIMFGRHVGWRGDTLSYMKLKDMTFTSVKSDEYTYLVVQNVGYKNKGIGGQELRNTVYGSSDFNECPVFALLWYLFHMRGVFEAESLQDMIDRNKFTLKTGAQEEYLFTQATTEQPMTSKDMSNLMKTSSAEILKCRYTMRSLRSGHICQALLTSILRYGIIKDSIRQAIKRHVGWSNDESIDAYERMSIFCSQNVASLQDLQQHTGAQNIVKAFWQMDSDKQSTPTPVRTTLREIRRSSSHPKKSPSSVKKFVSFRQVKKRILELRPNLSKACREEDEKTVGKNHQTTWSVYHQKYIKQWAESSNECQEVLNGNQEYIKGSTDQRSSILLNVGKSMFVKLAVGPKRDEYINKVFYEDYASKKNSNESGSAAKRFLPRGMKRKLDLTWEKDVEQPELKFHTPNRITIPETTNDNLDSFSLSQLVTQEFDEMDTETMNSMIEEYWNRNEDNQHGISFTYSSTNTSLMDNDPSLLCPSMFNQETEGIVTQETNNQIEETKTKETHQPRGDEDTIKKEREYLLSLDFESL